MLRLRPTAAASDADDRVPLAALARGALDALPEAAGIGRGLWNLVRATPDRRDSIGLRLQRLADATPHAIALKFEDRQYRYAEFNAWANRIAAGCRALGIGHGDAVAILTGNRPETLAAIAGVVKLGAVAVMLNPQQRGAVLAHSIRLSAPVLLIAGDDCVEALDSLSGAADVLAAIRERVWDGAQRRPGWRDWPAHCAAQSSENPPETAAVRLRDTAFHIFTSGTTGLPKASRMTHHRWIKGLAGLGQMTLRLTPDDTLYCPLPLYHNNALTVCWGAVLANGATLALARKFSASRFWDEIRRHEATAFCYIGELCRYLLNLPASADDRRHAVRLIVGNGLRPEIWDAFQQRFGIPRIAEFYGASESNLAFVNGFNVARTAGFCPLPYAIVTFDPDTETPRRDRHGRLQRVATGGVGLLISEVTERAPFDGYTDPGANESKLLRDVFRRGDVWFNTGDLVRDQGFRHIQFVDRVGDTFRWKGENVATTEVEAVLNGQPGIEQAVVYGVSVPGCDGRAGMAALTLAAATTFDGPTLAATLRAALPAYAVPLFVRIKDEQALTATFKFRKVELKREGFDPAVTTDPLYWLGPDGYRPLDAATHAQIVGGALRL